MDEFKVHVYPVGLLRDLRELRNEARCIVAKPQHERFHRQRIASLRYRLRLILRDALSGRRSYWNGYLAEPSADDIYWNRCGHGWTKRRAMASLVRHIGEVQRDGYLRYVPESVAS